MNVLKGFVLAFNMLTIIPFFKIHNFFKGINGFGVMFYPLIGFILGTIAYLLSLALEGLLPTPHLHLILFALLLLLTGALHLDGFSDTIDGLFVPKERAEAAMKDPHVGGMGMTFSITFLLLKASSFIYLEALYLLPVILMLSRFNVVLSIYFFPYIRQEGMSTLAKQEFTLTQLLFSVLGVLAVVIYTQTWALLLSSLILLTLIKMFFTKRYGGFSGDIYGFMIELTELVLLNVLIVGASL